MPPKLALDQALPQRKRVAAHRRVGMYAAVAWLVALPLAAVWYIAVPGTSDFVLGFVVFGSLYGGPVAAVAFSYLRFVESDLGEGVVFARRIPLRVIWTPGELGSFSVAEIQRAVTYTARRGHRILLIYGPRGQVATFGGFARDASFAAAQAWCHGYGVDVKETLEPVL